MSAVPGDIETSRQPPMAIPLRHFIVALAFLVLGALLGMADALDAAPGFPGLAHVHLLLVGWVCVTIMGAMTQFVPVWSGTELHSERLAAVQLWLVAGGLLGFAASLLAGAVPWLHAFGTAMVAGVWVFVYNVARTLPAPSSFDVTERHFALALAYFVAVTALGLTLAVDLAQPLGALLPVPRANLVAAHATLAVFGAVLTTVWGALYQLATMFTQTDLHGVDVHLRRVEEVGYPVGVVALAAGRLLGAGLLARVGGALVAGAVLAVTAILARRLYETHVNWTPMLSRYAVVVLAAVLWALLALPAWLRDPLAPDARFGAPGTTHLLLLGVVGFVVLGTLYHVVPFVVWLHRYSDLLGYEAVPMVDELYSHRVARVDLALFTAGTGLLVAADLAALPSPTGATGGALVLAGVVLFVANLLRVLHEHAPGSLAAVLFGRVLADPDAKTGESVESADHP